MLSQIPKYPNTQKLNRIAVAQPIGHEEISILTAQHVGQRYVVLPILLAYGNRCAVHGNHSGCGQSGSFNIDRVRYTKWHDSPALFNKKAIGKISHRETEFGASLLNNDPNLVPTSV